MNESFELLHLWDTMLYRKDSTNCEAFLLKKLVPKTIHTAAIHYENQHKQDAVTAYKHLHRKNYRTEVYVESCGILTIFINPS